MADAKPPHENPNPKGAARSKRPSLASVPAAGDWEKTLLGQTLGDCKLIRLVGSGSLSTIFEGHHRKLDIKVAVKVFRKREGVSAKGLMRFYSEARQAARLDHPNIVRVYDVDSTDRCHYIVMQFVDGKTLTKILQAKGRIPPKEVVSILGQALNGLAYAHNRKCIHRDIKPDNIMMTREGILKITDFGLAREAGVTAPKSGTASTSLEQVKAATGNYRNEHETQAGVLLGTPVYMPQEQWEDAGNIDRRADIYALGVTAYQLLSGRLPYTGNNAVQILKQIIRGEKKPLHELVPEVDSTLEAIIDRMMAPDRSRRYPRAEEAISDLRAWHAKQHAHEPSPDDSTLPRPINARPGDSFLHYELVEFRSHLGACEIWNARNQGTHQQVMLKILRDPKTVERLRHVEELVRPLFKLAEHKAILGLRDVLTSHQPPVVVYEPPAGETLREYVQANGPLSETQTINMLASLADVLASAHELGLVHGNLRETHVLVSPIDRNELAAKLFNFGTMPEPELHPLSLKLDMQEIGQGTPMHLAMVDWLAPEVAEGGALTPSSDLFGLGLLGIFALTGKRPGRNLHRQIEESGASKALADQLIALTEEEPTRRPSSSAEVARNLVQAKLLGALGATPPMRRDDGIPGGDNGGEVANDASGDGDSGKKQAHSSGNTSVPRSGRVHAVPPRPSGSDRQRQERSDD